jgi:hypothetical protein
MNTPQPQQQLAYVARAYFHEDWDFDDPTPLDVVRSFKRNANSEELAGLVSDLKSVLGSNMREDDLWQLWIEEYKASYDPRMEGNTYRGWFAEILSLLTDA